MTPQQDGRRTLVLVRHGETVGESSIRYHGANDVALSPHGIDQMRRVAETLRGETFERILTSTLQRSVTAAQIIAPYRQADALPGFDEINFGAWEGLTIDEIEARDAAGFSRWRRDPARFTFPGGDSVVGFRQRIVATFDALAPTLPARTLAVVHKGVISAILGHVRGEPIDQPRTTAIDLGSIHRVESDAAGWRVVAVNHLDHLGAEPLR